jgi:tetratricopeptide (TPR) repeat protein
VEDEARFAREIEGATRDRGDSAKLEAAAAIATGAIAADPGNPALSGILEGIDLDRGDAEAALQQAKRAADLLPRDFALSADLASVLMRLGRFDEAGTVLARASSGADLDLVLPVLDQFWSRTKRLREGIGFIDKALADRPNDLRLRVVRAGLLMASGDRVGAEQGYRSVLVGDPSSEDAQEGLVALLEEEGRADEAAKASAEAAPFQARNQGNSLRAAKYCEAHGDTEGLVRNLLAAEQSGPVTRHLRAYPGLETLPAKAPRRNDGAPGLCPEALHKRGRRCRDRFDRQPHRQIADRVGVGGKGGPALEKRVDKGGHPRTPKDRQDADQDEDHDYGGKPPLLVVRGKGQEFSDNPLLLALRLFAE